MQKLFSFLGLARRCMQVYDARGICNCTHYDIEEAAMLEKLSRRLWDQVLVLPCDSALLSGMHLDYGTSPNWESLIVLAYASRLSLKRPGEAVKSVSDGGFGSEFCFFVALFRPP
jgi:hypothetical protein